MTLPAFKLIGGQSGPRSSVSPPGAPLVPSISTPASSTGNSYAAAAVLPLRHLLEPPLGPAPGAVSQGYGPPPQTSPRQRALDRRLSGEVYAGEAGGTQRNIATLPQIRWRRCCPPAPRA
jgi:hypothetical protein